MKALTLTQPWATLVAIGAKQIETRSWATNYCGPLAIHAAAGLGPVGGNSGLNELVAQEPFWTVLGAAGCTFGRRAPTGLPFGAIVAVCELVCCTRITFAAGDARGWYGVVGRDWSLTDRERAFGDYADGRYAWLLADIRALPTPIPAKGALRVWEWDAADAGRAEAGPR
jgi:activating signal cointegrator 1